MPRSSEPSEASGARLVRGDPGGPHARFEQAVDIEAPSSRIRDVLCTLEQLAPLHPLIESIRTLPADPDRPRARRYRVVDRIPLGPWRARIAYTAELEALANDEVRGEAWQSPAIHLVTRYRLESLAPARTRVHETCEIRAPLGLRRFVTRQASASHRSTLEGLKRLLEAEHVAH